MPAPLRITFVVDGPLEQTTGGYLYDRRVIDGLRARGASVEILRLGGALGTVADAARFARHVERCNGIVVVDELCHPRVALAARLWSVARQHRTERARLVTLVHHLAASETSGLRSAARLVVERALLDASDRLVVTSQTTRDVLVRIGARPERIRVALPGRDRLGTRMRPPAPGADGTVRLLFVGAVSRRKGALDVAHAFQAVAHAATLTFVGPLDRDRAYAAAVADAVAAYGARVRILGEVGDGALEALLDTHDVLVLPSRYEGYGIALAEAASHGLAIVATRAGAIAEVVRDGREAMLVEPGDVGALARALRGVVLDADRRSAMQADALERAEQLPTWSETEARFADALAWTDDAVSARSVTWATSGARRHEAEKL